MKLNQPKTTRHNVSCSDEIPKGLKVPSLQKRYLEKNPQRSLVHTVQHGGCSIKLQSCCSSPRAGLLSGRWNHEELQIPEPLVQKLQVCVSELKMTRSFSFQENNNPKLTTTSSQEPLSPAESQSPQLNLNH